MAFPLVDRAAIEAGRSFRREIFREEAGYSHGFGRDLIDRDQFKNRRADGNKFLLAGIISRTALRTYPTARSILFDRFNTAAG